MYPLAWRINEQSPSPPDVFLKGRNLCSDRVPKTVPLKDCRFVFLRFDRSNESIPCATTGSAGFALSCTGSIREALAGQGATLNW